MTELEAIERRIEQLSEEDRKTLLKRLERFNLDEARRHPFFRLKGSIKTGPGDVLEDIRIARDTRGRVQ